MAIQADTKPVESSPKSLRRFPAHGFFGILIVVFAETALFLREPFVGLYFTPIVWTGYILVADGLLCLTEGGSFIRAMPKSFLLMLPWSVICWLVFEGFNLYLQNWRYVGLPESSVARLVGYLWSFATIFPAVLLTGENIERRRSFSRLPFSIPISRPLLYCCIGGGTMMLVVPLLLPQELAEKLFAFVWIGFILVLDPINYLQGRRSVLGDMEKGKIDRFVSLMTAGFVCGFLWEFWNYWAAAKWLYSIPLTTAGPKVFEMPLLGYLGFLPFAVECFVMNEFLYVLFPTLKNK